MRAGEKAVAKRRSLFLAQLLLIGSFRSDGAVRLSIREESGIEFTGNPIERLEMAPVAFIASNSLVGQFPVRGS